MPVLVRASLFVTECFHVYFFFHNSLYVVCDSRIVLCREFISVCTYISAIFQFVTFVILVARSSLEYGIVLNHLESLNMVKSKQTAKTYIEQSSVRLARICSMYIQLNLLPF